MELELTKKDRGFDEIRWVAKGLTTNKRDKRVRFNYVYKDGNRFVSTDGERLHMFEKDDNFEDCEDGFYEVIKNTKTIVILSLKFKKDEEKFLDFEDLVAIKYDFPQDTFQVSNDKLDLAFADIIRNMKGEKVAEIVNEPTNSLRFDHLKAVLSSDDMFSVYHENENKPICFKGNNLFALIMPIRG